MQNLSAPDISFYASQSVKKNLIEFTQNRVFFRSGLSGLSFHSRQNTQCDVLGLPDLVFVGRILPLSRGRFICQT